MTSPAASPFINPEHAPDMSRPRFWGCTFLGDVVFVRHYPLLEPGEELTEATPTIRLTRAEWLERHAEWGLGADGQPLEVT